MATERKHERKMDPEAMKELYKKLGTPGAPHALLSRMAGSWNIKSKTWEPGMPPEESSGTSEQKMILGGRFLQQESTGEWMGGAFNGLGFTGYDNNTKKFVSTWMDSMGTALFFFEGPMDEDGKGFTQRSSYDDPVKGLTEWRSRCRLVDDNTVTFEMYGKPAGGKEEKMMEMTYTRKQ